MIYRLNLEEVDHSWVAHVAELPGCFAVARTFGAALAQAPQAIADYLGWINSHGETVTPHEITPELGEMHRAWTNADQTEVNAFFAADRLPVTSAEAARFAQLLEWARADLLMALSTLSAAQLQLPIDNQDSAWQMVRHLALSEHWLLERLETAGPAPMGEPLEQLRLIRVRLQAALPGWVDNPRVIERNLELWSARKLLRRVLWHERDHTAQLRRFARTLRPITRPLINFPTQEQLHD